MKITGNNYAMHSNSMCNNLESHFKSFINQVKYINLNAEKIFLLLVEDYKYT